MTLDGLRDRAALSTRNVQGALIGPLKVWLGLELRKAEGSVDPELVGLQAQVEATMREVLRVASLWDATATRATVLRCRSMLAIPVVARAASALSGTRTPDQQLALTGTTLGTGDRGGRSPAIDGGLVVWYADGGTGLAAMRGSELVGASGTGSIARVAVKHNHAWFFEPSVALWYVHTDVGSLTVVDLVEHRAIGQFPAWLGGRALGRFYVDAADEHGAHTVRDAPTGEVLGRVRAVDLPRLVALVAPGHSAVTATLAAGVPHDRARHLIRIDGAGGAEIAHDGSSADYRDVLIDAVTGRLALLASKGECVVTTYPLSSAPMARRLLLHEQQRHHAALVVWLSTLPPELRTDEHHHLGAELEAWEVELAHVAHRVFTCRAEELGAWAAAQPDALVGHGGRSLFAEALERLLDEARAQGEDAVAKVLSAPLRQLRKQVAPDGATPASDRALYDARVLIRQYLDVIALGYGPSYTSARSAADALLTWVTRLHDAHLVATATSADHLPPPPDPFLHEDAGPPAFAAEAGPLVDEVEGLRRETDDLLLRAKADLEVHGLDKPRRPAPSRPA